MVNFFSSCKKSGEFVHFGEATLIYGSDLYQTSSYSFFLRREERRGREGEG
jgi:hypothetical protein